MPNRPHNRSDCDEDCRGCLPCYIATGDTICDWTCKHTSESHADDIAELAHDGYCDCDSCRMERARDTSEEYAHD